MRPDCFFGFFPADSPSVVRPEDPVKTLSFFGCCFFFFCIDTNDLLRAPLAEAIVRLCAGPCEIASVEGVSSSVLAAGAKGKRRVCLLPAQSQNPSFYLVLSNKDMCDAKGKYYSVYLTCSLCRLIVCIQKTNPEPTCNCPPFLVLIGRVWFRCRL